MEKIKRIIKIFTVSLLALFFAGGLIWHVAEAAPQGEASREEVLVGLEDTFTSEDYGFIEARGGEVVNELENINVLVVELPEKAVDRAMEAWDRSPRISYVEENGEMHALGEGSWGTERIGSREAQEKSTGEGVKVGILDSGIDVNHEALKDNIAGGEAIVECSPHPHCDEPWDDDHGHGTHVAGTAGSVNEKIGVATEVELYSIKVLDRNARGSVSDVSEGIIWAADNDMEVINMSLGSSSDSYGNTIREAVEYANEEGVIQIAAAGNNNLEEDSVVYPAAFEEVIAVSATNEDDEMAEFSSIGPEVEFAAPGADIYSAWEGGRYYEGNGTSMASPHVTGVAALVLAMEGYETEEEVREPLQDTAEDIGFDENKQGYGLINAAEAVGVEVEDRHDISITHFEGDTVTKGEKAEIEITVENAGDFDYVGDDSVEVNIVNDDTEDVLLEKEVALESGESYTDMATWITTDDTEVKDYTMSGSAEAVMEEEKVASDSDTTTVTVEEKDEEDDDEEDDGDEEVGPEIVEFEIENTSNPAWNRAEVTWAVAGNELDTVKLEMFNEEDKLMDSKTINVSGSEADGVDELRSRDGGSYVVITVTNGEGYEDIEEDYF